MNIILILLLFLSSFFVLDFIHFYILPQLKPNLPYFSFGKGGCGSCGGASSFFMCVSSSLIIVTTAVQLR